MNAESQDVQKAAVENSDVEEGESRSISSSRIARNVFLQSVVGAVTSSQVSDLQSLPLTCDEEPRAPPDLYTDIHYFLESAEFIYAFIRVRDLARAGKIRNPDSILAAPISYLQILEFTWSHRAILEQFMSPEEYAFFVDILDGAEKLLEDEAFRLGIAGGLRTLSDTPDKFGIVVCGDEHQPEEFGGLVYMIEVDCLHRRVTVTFRGTATVHDAHADMNLFMEEIPNPMVNAGLPQVLRVHGGFAENLYGTSRKGERDAKSTANFRSGTKCREIINKVCDVMKANPGFHLYTTGHSLGGALASLFAFEVASCDDPNIPSPITCVAIVPPRFANLSFRKSFEHLENQGKLRCLSVINVLDPVPMMPSRFLCFCCLVLSSPDRLYRHVGLQLRLLPRDWGFHLRYRRRATSPLAWFKDLVRGLFRFFFSLFFIDIMCCMGRRYHSNREYSRRLKENFEDLKGFTIDGLYHLIHDGCDETLLRKISISSLINVRQEARPMQRKSAETKVGGDTLP